MNELKMYAIFDVKAELFHAPHFIKSDGVAIRSFSTACEDEKTDFWKYPEDFSLYCIGKFNTETGELFPAVPRQIANASEFVDKTLSEKRVSKEEIENFARQKVEELNQKDSQDTARQ
jgi:hypothetical protein